VEEVERLEARHTEALRAVSYEPLSRRFSVFAFYLNAGTIMAFPRTVLQPNSLTTFLGYQRHSPRVYPSSYR
jgi:hypothetical protein